MNWRLKCFALRALDVIPAGDTLHAWLQRHVTGRYFRRFTDGNLNAHLYHVENYRKLGRPGTALEFGAGGSLSAALLLSAAGARVFTFDISRLAAVERINYMIGKYRERGLEGDWPDINSLDDLERLYNIHYMAPADVRATGLPPGSVDYFYSMSCLEHIPTEDIRKILAELRRIASPEALFGFGIGYYDHYATADKSISKCNFYRYSDRQWKRWNPPRHYHNRLRHGDFERLFKDFELLDNERILAPEGVLDGIRIDPKFSDYSRQDLLTVSGRFLMRAKSGGLAPLA